MNFSTKNRAIFQPYELRPSFPIDIVFPLIPLPEITFNLNFAFLIPWLHLTPNQDCVLNVLVNLQQLSIILISNFDTLRYYT